MSESTLNCPNCLRPVHLDASECPGCASTLLVDVIPSDRPADAKARYQLARALAAVPGAPTLAALRAALEAEGAPLVRGVTRAAAAAFESVLSEQGILALLQPSVPAAPPRSLKRYTVHAIALALVVVGTVCVARKSANTDRAAVAVTTPYAMPPSTGHPIRPAATTHCPNEAPGGAGYFVHPTHVLISARSLCDGNGPVLRVSDGREVLTTVSTQSTKFDLAVVEADRAGDVQPFPLGDATILRPGDRVQIVGGGAATSAGRGRVVSIASEEQGVGWVRVDVGQQPVADGDAVLDVQGRLVGIVRVPGANEQVVRVLPINYAYDSTENGGLPLISPLPLPAPDPNVWHDYLRAVNDDEVTRGKAFVEGLERRPGVFESAWFAPGDGISAKLVVRSYSPPQLGDMDFDVRMYGTPICSGRLSQSYVWDYFDHRSNLTQARSHARWNWISQLNLSEHLYIVDMVASGGPFRACLAGRKNLVLHVRGAARDLDVVPLETVL